MLSVLWPVSFIDRERERPHIPMRLTAERLRSCTHRPIHPQLVVRVFVAVRNLTASAASQKLTLREGLGYYVRRREPECEAAASGNSLMVNRGM